MVVGPFNQGTRELCFNVVIEDDDDPERNECFFIDFVPDFHRVQISPPRAKVTIQDDDCKLSNTMVWLNCFYAHVQHCRFTCIELSNGMHL